MQICSKLLIEKMFYYKFFCQTIQCPNKEGGRIPPPSDVSPTEKHADVTRVKHFQIRIMSTFAFITLSGYLKTNFEHVEDKNVLKYFWTLFFFAPSTSS